jgi:hypothetical protein
MTTLLEHYLTLVARTLVGTIYDDPPLPAMGQTRFDPRARELGWDWPSVAFTMVGAHRLANVRHLLESVIRDGVPGDFVETGVWRGGASIMARAVLFAHGVTDRRVILCDSFEGLPPPDPERYPADAGATFHLHAALAVSEETVRHNFSRFDLLDDQVVFLKGWFKDTMPRVPSETIAVLRLDGDLYESTIDPLNALYDRIPRGGYVIVDDYHAVPTSKEAVHDFLSARGEAPAMVMIEGGGAYFRK